ncbi:RNP domain protein [Terfezia claveryi]|nr:RNP domain protein [Terfezia claveryi]
MSENTAVENVTATLEKTKLEAPVTNEAEVAHAASAAEGRRLYIGNLAYSTTEEQLKVFFRDFSVESVSIPTNPRTGRAVGYAFVDLHTKEEAEHAITELSGKEVLERKVSVQAARKPGAQSSGGAKEGEAAGGDFHERRGRGRYNKRKPRARGPKNRGAHNGAPEAVAPVNVPGQVLPLTEATTAVQESPAKQENPLSSALVTEGHGGYKGRRRRGPPEDGVPSKTKVMVANLPYELSEEKLKELFAAFQPESAKIALRPIRSFMVRILAQRGEARKGRGFGFVTLASEEMQQKAIEEMNGKTVEGREIAVKVAIDNPKLEAEAEAKAAHKEATSITEAVKGESLKAEAATNGVKAEAAPVATTTA